jgi:hypothetical protein
LRQAASAGIDHDVPRLAAAADRVVDSVPDGIGAGSRLERFELVLYARDKRIALPPGTNNTFEGIGGRLLCSQLTVMRVLSPCFRAAFEFQGHVSDPLGYLSYVESHLLDKIRMLLGRKFTSGDTSVEFAHQTRIVVWHPMVTPLKVAITTLDPSSHVVCKPLQEQTCHRLDQFELGLIREKTQSAIDNLLRSPNTSRLLLTHLL